MARRIFCTLAVAITAIVAQAPSASAHTVNGLGPTNYRSSITGIEPKIKGLDVFLVESGNRIKLVNNSGKTVVVVGYQGEDYLRIDKNGVFENQNSPATYLNRTRNASSPVPDNLDSTGKPNWKQLSSGNSVTWHDHRIHWMANTPAIAKSQPNSAHTIIPNSVVPLRVDGAKVQVHLKVAWLPSNSPWIYFIGVVVAAAATFVAVTRLKTRYVIAGIFIGMVAIDIIYRVSVLHHFEGSWLSTLDRNSDVVTFSLIAWVLLLIAAWMELRLKSNSHLIAGAGALFLLATASIPDVSNFWLPIVPSDLSRSVARALLALEMGVGIGLVLAALPTLLSAGNKKARVDQREIGVRT